MYYTENQLKQYEYFQNQLAITEHRNLLDPLTGLVSRPGMIGLAKDLIAREEPFAYCILDLDNFKFVNDTYGHHAGDAVLIELARLLREYLGERGVAGRFGGDEFLILIPGLKTYDDRKAFLKELYESGRVLRRNYTGTESHPFITGTIGCAGFPENAQDYDGLFTLMDKALYRGKTKGRNCYIIYLEEKHKNIEIQRIARQGMFTAMNGLVRAFEMVPGLRNRLESVTPFLMDTLRVSDLYYMGNDLVLHSVRQPGLAAPVPDADRLVMMNDLFATNNMEEIRERCPVFHEVLVKMEVETLMVVRVMMEGKSFGTLLLAEPRSLRIWQEDESAVMYFLAKLMAYRLCMDGESLTDAGKK